MELARDIKSDERIGHREGWKKDRKREGGQADVIAIIFPGNLVSFEVLCLEKSEGIICLILEKIN